MFGGPVVDTGIVSSQELRREGLQLHKLPSPWSIFFPRGLGKPLSITLWGPPGSGKSTLAMLLANSWNGRAIFLSYEEGVHSPTMREKVVRLSIDKIDFSRPVSSAGMISAIVDYDLFVIDSLMVCGSHAEELVDLSVNSKKSMILISHVCKDGTVKGGTAASHLTDVSIEVTKDEETDEIGRFRLNKTRFSDTFSGWWRRGQEPFVFEVSHDMPELSE